MFFTKHLDRRNFYFFGNKAKINQVLDLRVEDMVLNPLFFREINDFASAIYSKEDSQNQIKINPLVRSIGFLESMHFLQKLYVNGEV